MEPSRLAHYLGRQRDRALEGKHPFGTWEYPCEDLEDGCPAGWRSSPLVWGVVRRARKRTRDGGRVPNPFFDRIDDDVLLAAVLHYEAQEDAVVAYWDQQIAEEHAAERRRLKAQRGR